jgi:hypothetical protein
MLLSIDLNFKILVSVTYSAERFAGLCKDSTSSPLQQKIPPKSTASFIYNITMVQLFYYKMMEDKLLFVWSNIFNLLALLLS